MKTLLDGFQRLTSSVAAGRKLKRRLHNQATACGLTLWFSSTATKTDAFILVTHHRVSSERDPYYPLHYSVDARVLEAQLAMLHRFCAVLSLDEIIVRLDQGKPLPKRCVALTFDDGYRELFTLVHPLLAQYRMPATVFIATDSLDKGYLWPDLLRWTVRSSRQSAMRLEALPDEPRAFDLSSDAHRLRAMLELDRRLKRMPDAEKGAVLHECVRQLHRVSLERFFVPRVMLTWEELGLMAQENWTVGAHTQSHPVLTQVPAIQAQQELSGCRALLSRRLKKDISHFAYPNGGLQDFSPEIEQLVKQAGYRSACSTVPGINGRNQNRWALKRIDGAQVSLREFVRVIEEADACPA